MTTDFTESVAAYSGQLPPVVHRQLLFRGLVQLSRQRPRLLYHDAYADVREVLQDVSVTHPLLRNAYQRELIEASGSRLLSGLINAGILEQIL